MRVTSAASLTAFSAAALAVCGCIMGGDDPADLTGTWDFYSTLELVPEIHEGAFDLVQIGSSLTLYDELGDEIGTGWVQGDSMALYCQPIASEPDYTSTVEGTIVSGSHMEGTWTNSYGDSGTWRAERVG